MTIIHPDICNIHIDPELVVKKSNNTFNWKLPNSVVYSGSYNTYQINNKLSSGAPVPGSIFRIIPNDDYGFILMDQKQSILMLNNSEEDLEIPYILFDSKKIEDEDIEKWVIHIPDIHIYLTIDWLSIVHKSKTAQQHYISKNKEQRRNFKLL